MAKIEDVTLAQGRTNKRTFVISPTSILFQVWEGCIALTCLLTTIFVTFQLAFKENTPELTVVIYISDALYLAHIVVKFHLGFIWYGSLVTDRKVIKGKYLKREFGIDLLTMLVLPFDIESATRTDGQTTDFTKIVRILALLRILRFYSLTSYFGK